MKVEHTKAAILVESHKPLEIDYLIMKRELEAGQVLVKILYTSICGAQLNEIDAVKGPDKFLPHLLGHEASAQVLEIGPGVTHVKPNDYVILHWRPGLGIQARPAWYGRGGEMHTVNAGWVTTFQEYAVVSENRCTAIPGHFDMKVAPLLGCAITTAAGVVNNDANVKIGESVVVIGVGGVGLNVVQFAKLAGAHPILAVDIHRSKLDVAVQYGATATWRYEGDKEYFLKGARTMLGGRNPDVVIETTGLPHMIELGIALTNDDGRYIDVGVPHGNINVNTLQFHLGKKLIGSKGGGSEPHKDIPRLLRLYEARKVSWDRLITHEFSLDNINEAIALMRKGTSGRIVIRP